MGDPKGIGPELVVKLCHFLDRKESDGIRLYGDIGIFDKAARMIGAEVDRNRIIPCSAIGKNDPDDGDAARSAILALDAAIEDAGRGRIHAIVTSPVNKGRMRKIKPDFTGHTEYFSGACGIEDATMMFISDATQPNPLCLALVTRHIPLRDVPSAITRKSISTTIERTAAAIRALTNKASPLIAVMALNPHAGENGAFGDEESEIIAPAVSDATSSGIECKGPLPSDSILGGFLETHFDGIVAMYHDQGALPIKLLSRGLCVNATLGLPFIRTSPGHGTAEDIAWQSKADPRGMIAAYKTAKKFLNNIY